ncbi:hypothetical protein AB9E19_13240 [Rhizobium leguminosarum]|uniref:hypothetical protein n=1 Tax=Rhizobium leguminosarum TaxID=384 RepID=UPI003F9BD562
MSLHIGKGERGALVVYAAAKTRTGEDTGTVRATERDIPTVKKGTFDQIEGVSAGELIKIINTDRPLRG